MKAKKFAAVALAAVIGITSLTGCMNKSATVASMKDQDVSLGVVNFMCRFQQAQSDESLKAYYQSDVWQQDLMNSGSTMQETVKEQIVESVHEMYTLKAHMSDYNIEITKDDKKAIEKATKQFMKDNDKATLKEIGATEEIVEEVLTLYTIREKMHDAIVAEADTNITDEEANMRGYTMVMIGTSGSASEDGQFVAYTEEEVEAIKVKAAEMQKSLETNKDLEAVAEEFGYSATKGTYGKNDTSLDEAVKTALDELAVGEISQMIEGTNGIYFVRIDTDCDEEATEKNKETILNKRQDALYTEKLAAWQENDDWKVNEKVLAKIVFKNNFVSEKETEKETENE